MSDRFLDPALEQLKDLLKGLNEACEVLPSSNAHIDLVGRVEDEVSRMEEGVVSELTDAGLLSLAQELEEQRRNQVALSSQLGTSVTEYLGHLQDLVAEAAQLASSIPAMVEDACRQAVEALEERRATLDGLRARAVQAFKERVRCAAPPSRGEERMPADETLGEDHSSKQRKSLDDRLTLKARLAWNDRLVSGRVESVGHGGLFVATEEKLELGTLVHIECVLPQGKTAEADGVVAWKRESKEGTLPGVGIELLALSETWHEAMEEVLSGAGENLSSTSTVER